MKTINAYTKISQMIKAHPAALDAIVSLSPKFEKLRNPVLRKLMAGRTSIAMAARIGGCTPDDFFQKLEPLGFRINRDQAAVQDIAENAALPGFLKEIDPEQIVELDVRPVLESGADPLTLILDSIKSLKPGHVLKLVNSFEPLPLIALLKKQGFDSSVETLDENLVVTYFYRNKNAVLKIAEVQTAPDDWDETMQRFSGRMQTIDVRQLEMPLPMLTILDALERLPGNEALFVFHKRLPVFLLPELAERQFEYRTREISGQETHMLIFRN